MNRHALIGELLVFALPCYAIYLVYVPFAVLGVWVSFDIAMDALMHPHGGAPGDLLGIAPFTIASVAGCIGLPVLLRFAMLLRRVFRRSIGASEARAILARTLKCAMLPLGMLTLLMFGLDRGWRNTSLPVTDLMLNVAGALYVSGLPILIPAFHLRRILAAA